jgi:hypothetical protein
VRRPNRPSVSMAKLLLQFLDSLAMRSPFEEHQI